MVLESSVSHRDLQGYNIYSQYYTLYNMENKELALEHIVERCKKNYINILPHSTNKKPHASKMNVEKLPPRKQLSKTQIHRLLGQLNAVLQLLAQNYVMAKNKQLKARCYALIKEFRTKMLLDLDHFDSILSKKSRKQILRYKVDYAEMIGSHRAELISEVAPQVSPYQDPLLVYMFHPSIHSELFKNQIILDSNQGMNIIQRQVPVFNKLWVPILDQQQKTKSRFTKLDDRLLLIGMMRYGYKNSKIIKAIYFPERTEQQIRNRIKNLCAKPSNNPIRLWRISEEQELTDGEMKKLVRVFQQLGPRWKVISRYYDIKTVNYFESRYNPSRSQKGKDKQFVLQSNSFMEKFRIYQQELRLSLQPQQIYLQEGVPALQMNISDDEIEWDYEHTEMAEMDVEQEGQFEFRGGYKIINHQIFEYDQI